LSDLTLFGTLSLLIVLIEINFNMF